MEHESRLTRALRALLSQSRVAALGTVAEDGTAAVSMVPYALVPSTGMLVVHVSALAPHSRCMEERPRVSLLIMQPEQAGEPVHALPRVTLFGKAETLAVQSVAWQEARAAYLARFPEAEPMTALGDFRFVGIGVDGARQIAGFGAARDVGTDELMAVLRTREGQSADPV